MVNIDLKSINTISVLVRLLLALLCGGLIGLERGRAGRPAGFRTHILVCIGSALAIMTNQYVFQEFKVSDPTRMAAQVISGIGFLGAGTIMVTGKNKVKGLTTAAGLWATACMGLAIGIGFYIAGIVTSVLITFVTIVLHPVDNYLMTKSKIIDLYIEVKEGVSISMLVNEFKKRGLSVEYVEIAKSSNKENFGLIINLKSKKREIELDIISKVSEIEGIEFVEDI